MFMSSKNYSCTEYTIQTSANRSVSPVSPPPAPEFWIRTDPGHALHHMRGNFGLAARIVSGSRVGEGGDCLKGIAGLS
jgi:hypothetical protein